MLKGKLAYLSPEQVHGVSLDARSDIFAIGLVLYELLAGKKLFTQADPAEVEVRSFEHRARRVARRAVLFRRERSLHMAGADAQL